MLVPLGSPAAVRNSAQWKRDRAPHDTGRQRSTQMNDHEEMRRVDLLMMESAGIDSVGLRRITYGISKASVPIMTHN